MSDILIPREIATGVRRETVASGLKTSVYDSSASSNDLAAQIAAKQPRAIVVGRTPNITKAVVRASSSLEAIGILREPSYINMKAINESAVVVIGRHMPRDSEQQAIHVARSVCGFLLYGDAQHAVNLDPIELGPLPENTGRLLLISRNVGITAFKAGIQSVQLGEELEASYTTLVSQKPLKYSVFEFTGMMDPNLREIIELLIPSIRQRLVEPVA